VAQIRGLFDRLAQGAAVADDVTLARRESEALLREVAVDPRHRIVTLWHGHPPSPRLDLASLRRFHQQALGTKRPAAVLLKRRP
jgi:hypothetical protein